MVTSLKIATAESGGGHKTLHPVLMTFKTAHTNNSVSGGKIQLDYIPLFPSFGWSTDIFTFPFLPFQVERLRKIEMASDMDEILKEEIREYKETLTCPSCKVKRKDAVLTKCFHCFCYDCLRTRCVARVERWSVKNEIIATFFHFKLMLRHSNSLSNCWLLELVEAT